MQVAPGGGVQAARPRGSFSFPLLITGAPSRHPKSSSTGVHFWGVGHE